MALGTAQTEKEAIERAILSCLPCVLKAAGIQRLTQNQEKNSTAKVAEHNSAIGSLLSEREFQNCGVQEQNQRQPIEDDAFEQGESFSGSSKITSGPNSTASVRWTGLVCSKASADFEQNVAQIHRAQDRAQAVADTRTTKADQNIKDGGAELRHRLAAF